MATIPIITNASDLIRRLTAALMQYPRQSDAKPDVLGQFCKFFTPTVQQSKQLSVAGVATRGIDQVHLFFSSGGFKINRLEFDKFFGTEDMDVQSRYTGPFIPCAAGGDSIGYGSPSGATGTLGCIVTDVAKGRYLLGCNHVFANLNVGKIPNHMDAAVAKPDPKVPVSTVVGGGIGVVGGTHPGAAYNIPVKKFGKASLLTQADLIFDDMSFVMSYGSGSALFVKQYGIVEAMGGIFAQNGDSGSLVVSLKNEAVGLLFCVASKGNVAVASPIDTILTRFGVSF